MVATRKTTCGTGQLVRRGRHPTGGRPSQHPPQHPPLPDLPSPLEAGPAPEQALCAPRASEIWLPLSAARPSCTHRRACTDTHAVHTPCHHGKASRPEPSEVTRRAGSSQSAAPSPPEGQAAALAGSDIMGSCSPRAPTFQDTGTNTDVKSRMKESNLINRP